MTAMDRKHKPPKQSSPGKHDLNCQYTWLSLFVPVSSMGCCLAAANPADGAMMPGRSGHWESKGLTHPTKMTGVWKIPAVGKREVTPRKSTRKRCLPPVVQLRVCSRPLSMVASLGCHRSSTEDSCLASLPVKQSASNRFRSQFASRIDEKYAKACFTLDLTFSTIRRENVQPRSSQ
jgi:hypothetical protein